MKRVNAERLNFFLPHAPRILSTENESEQKLRPDHRHTVRAGAHCTTMAVYGNTGIKQES